MNVDQEEIHKFSAMASRWWDKEGECKPLHAINPLRMQFIQSHVELDKQTALDVGCGGGILTEALAAAGAKATGIDLAEASLKIAQLHLHESKLAIDYQCITAEDFAAQHPESIDVLTCMEMLEHVPDPQSIVRSCAALLKPGGHAFFSTLNRSLKSFVQAIVGAEYVLNMIPKGTHHYEKFIKPNELIQWAREAGLSVQHNAGIQYNPLSQQYKLTDKVDVNYLLHFTKA